RALVVMQFQARTISNPGDAEIAYLKSYFEPVRSRYIGVLRNLLPHLTIDDVLWRYNMCCCAIVYSMGGPLRMTYLPRDFEGVALRDVDNEASAIDHLVAFLSAGFRAPSIFVT